MISVQEAKHIIRTHAVALPPVLMPLQQAAGKVLAGDVYSATDIPAYNQSAMDGYALSYEGWQRHHSLSVQGEMPAGSAEQFIMQHHQAVRIFTGAAVPAGADTVVMQEKIALNNGRLQILDEKLQPGHNVRPKGSEIKAGELALPKGALLTPAAIGFLATTGVAEVMVYPSPVVSIIVTGNELQPPGEPLAYGQVYECNSYALRAVLNQLGIDDIRLYKVRDEAEAVQEVLSQALLVSNMVILTGGVSVGHYDFVPEAAATCGVTKLFHKIKQRPGKPLFVGMKENKMVFGLPGNPSSVLTCFYEYVIPALEQVTQRNHLLKVVQAPIGKDYNKTAPLTFFLKGHYDGQQATPLEAQESYRLRSFAVANCLLCLPEHKMDFKKGDMVEVHLLDL
jgi:molybdenum cofactor synthesis domain